MTLASSRGRLRYTLYVFIFASFLFVRPGPGVRAATITVNAECNLIDAITAANLDTARGNCPAGSGADTIVLTDNVELNRYFIIYEPTSTPRPTQGPTPYYTLEPTATPTATVEPTVDMTATQITPLSCSSPGSLICGSVKYPFPEGLEISSDITIRGNGYRIRNGTYIRTVRPQRRIFKVTTTGRLTIVGAVLAEARYENRAHGTARREGGAIRNAGHLHIDKSVFYANRAFEGGAIYSSGTLIVKDSSFIGNYAVREGGAIFVDGGSIQISDSSFVENSTWLKDGGAIWSSRPLTITRSTFLRNAVDQSRRDGGAIFSTGSRISISNSTFGENSAPNGSGGAIRLSYPIGNSTISNSYFRNNTAEPDSRVIETGLGGAISIDKHSQNASILTIAGSRFDGNRARHGGAIGSRSMGLVVRTSSFKDNHASEHGGAIFRSYEGTSPIGLQVENSTFYQNLASAQGNAVYVGYYAAMNSFASRALVSWIKNSTFVDNQLNAPGYGTTAIMGLSISPINVYNSIFAETRSGTQSCSPVGRQHGNLSRHSACAPHGNNNVRQDPRVGAVVEPAGAPAYFPLQADSPAIGAGVAAHCPGTDQLGNARPQPAGSRCDSGAVEYAEAPLTSSQQQAADTTTPTATQSPTANATDHLVQNAPMNVQGQRQMGWHSTRMGRAGRSAGWIRPVSET